MMKRELGKLAGFIAALVLIVTLALPVLAVSDITNAKWWGVLTISNNSTAASAVSVNVSNLSTQALIDGNYMNATATNAAVRNSSGADVAFMPGYGTAPWAVWVPSIGTNGYESELLYTDNSSGGKIRYFPGTAGMTTADNTTLEPSDNFTMEWSGYLNTDNGTGKNLVDKIGAMSVFVSPTVSQNVTASIYYTGAAGTTFPVVATTNSGSAAASTNHVVNMPAGTLNGDLIIVIISNFNAVGDPTLAAPAGGGWTSLGVQASGAYYKGGVWYKITTGAETSPQTWTSSQSATYSYHTMRISRNTFSSVVAPVMSKTGGTASIPNPLTLTSGFGAVDTLWIAPAASTATQASYPAGYTDGQAVVGTAPYLYTARRNYTGVTQDPGAYGTSVNIWVAFTIAVKGLGPLSVSATGVASGEKTVKVEANGTFLGLGIDQTPSSGWPLTTNLVMNAPLYHSNLSTSPLTTKDSTGFTANVTNAVWSSSSGYYFDGVGDYIRAPATIAPAEITVGIWAKFSLVQNAAQFSDPIGKDHGGTSGVDLQTNLTVAAQQNWLVGQGATLYSMNYAIADVNWYDNQWHYLVMTKSNTTGMIIYRDGVAIKTQASYTLPISWGSGTWYIGSSSITARALTGYVGETQIYNTGLSAAQVLANYNATRWKYDGSATYPQYEKAVSVPNNANNWTDVSGGVMSYVQHVKKWVGGNLQQYIYWEYATTFSDHSPGGLHPATPSFRTTSSDPDVSASLTSFLPIAEAKAPAYTLGSSGPDFISGNITMSGGFPTTPSPLAAPGVSVITTIAASTNTPPQLPLFFITAFIMVAGSLIISWFIRQHGSGSLMPKLIWLFFCIGVLVTLKIWDWWMLIFFVMIVLPVASASRQGST